MPRAATRHQGSVANHPWQVQEEKKRKKLQVGPMDVPDRRYHDMPDGIRTFHSFDIPQRKRLR